jgi:galactokinase
MIRSFQEVFGLTPAATGKAPGRVNLLGDHTDYNGGFVLPTVISRETVVQLAAGDTFEAFSEQLGWGQLGTGDFSKYIAGCIVVLAESGIEVPPLKVHVSSTVPVGAGLSSSAALEIATLRAICKLLHLELEPKTLAKLAHQVEVQHAGVRCGIMDQMACSIGQREQMLFLDTLNLSTQMLPYPCGTEVLVIDTGVKRSLDSTAYNERRAECERAADMLGVPTLRSVTELSAIDALPAPLKERARHVISENQRVLTATTASAAGFGEIMSESHASLRDDFVVSLPVLDALVTMLDAQPEVFGARLTGAGFGGCCVALVSEGASARVAAMILETHFTGCRPVPVQPVALSRAASPPAGADAFP